MIENASAALTLLPADHEVVVTREEHHQDVLQPWAPRPGGQPREVAVELVRAPITHGRHAGRPGVEVRLDGRRAGELTDLMARRYGPLLDAHRAAGHRHRLRVGPHTGALRTTTARPPACGDRAVRRGCRARAPD